MHLRYSHLPIVIHVIITLAAGHNDYINRSDGRYCYNQMPFGIASRPEEYQQRQHEFLDRLSGVINIADDICVYGCSDIKEEADIDHD